MVEGNFSLSINRPIFEQSTIDTNYLRKSDPSDGKRWRPNIRCSPRKALIKVVPIIGWISDYKWSEYLIKDAISGFTVAIMNIPQGMAYALLGNVPPVVGIYMAFLPVIVYAFLGTSRHVSMGSFAVICLMTGKVVTAYSSPDTDLMIHLNSTSDVTLTNQNYYTPLQVGTAVTFLVAIFQIIMFILRLGIVGTLLSDTLINGFTAGAAVHVLTSQIKDVFGVKLPKITGSLVVVQTYVQLALNIKTANVTAVIMSAVTMAVIILNNEVLKPWISKKTFVPIPIELIVVLAGTIISSQCGLDETYHLKTVGNISVGLPGPELPVVDLLPSIALDSLIIAVIAYVVSLSMALIFANKLQYKIDANQELLAQGCSNLVGSFFSCLPMSASLSRSVIQQTVGGCTQLASLVSASILVLVLLWIAPFFEPLPRCVLSSLIVVALKGVLFQVFDLASIWRSSRLDGIVWLATYLSVVLIEIDVGLLVGVATSILALLARGLTANIVTLQRLPSTDIYVDSVKYDKTERISGVTVVRYSGCINFINRTYFRKSLFKALNFESQKTKGNKVTPSVSHVEYIVLDFCALQYVDPAGAQCLLGAIKEFEDASKHVIIAAASNSIYESLLKCSPDQSQKLNWFPTIHDAVSYSQRKLDEPVYSIRL